MRKFIILLILLFPTLAFGQSYTGNYKANFYLAYLDKPSINIEFEVKPNNLVIGKLRINDRVRTISGKVKKDGSFKAETTADDYGILVLSGSLKPKNNRVMLTNLVPNGSDMDGILVESPVYGKFYKLLKQVRKKL